MTSAIRIDELRSPWLWWAALAIGMGYIVPVVINSYGPAIILWKGAGVGLLALWAAVNAQDRFGQMFAVALGFCAMGDILIETSGLSVGGAAFAAGHLIAIALYLQNPRAAPTGSQRALALLVVPLSLVIAWALLQGDNMLIAGMAYTAVVAAMAAAAWASSFPRYRTGIGAMLFLISDLVIFARLGGAIDSDIARVLIWPLYFTGQALIAWGVVTSLAARRR
ncbi:MAG: lysoplasmalogenase [Sphingopyxis sp.]|nr:lysoplasmalogenase [Sphingopyxis sp.]